MHDVIELAHNVIAGEHHLIIQLLRDIDSLRSVASCSPGHSTDGDKAVQARNGDHRHQRHCFSSGTPTRLRELAGAEPMPGVGRPGRYRPWCGAD
jgi:hypothetical protein